MITALSFKTSKRAFRPWEKNTDDPAATFRLFAHLIRKTIETPPQVTGKPVLPNGQSGANIVMSVPPEKPIPPTDTYTHRTPQ